MRRVQLTKQGHRYQHANGGYWLCASTFRSYFDLERSTEPVLVFGPNRFGGAYRVQVSRRKQADSIFRTEPWYSYWVHVFNDAGLRVGRPALYPGTGRLAWELFGDRPFYVGVEIRA